LKFFYFGVHTDNGKPYFGSPKTNKWVWDLYDHEIQIIMRFETRDEAEKAEDRIIEATISDEWSLNNHYGGYFPEKSRLKGIDTQRQMGVGFFSGGWDFEILSKAGRKGCRVSHKVCEENQIGFYSKENQSKAGKIGGVVTSSQKWVDPDHPELGSHNAGNLVRMQKRRNLPCGPENRRKA
jgi:hypothetical protein